MPRYELSEGTSNKFWEIELTGSSYTSKWGKIGSGSTSMSTKQHKDDAAAKKEYDKLIAEKVKKGYQLVDGGGATQPAPSKSKPGAAPSGPARNASLEKAILANPDDTDAYLVYADWMQSNGEIRGELAALQHAGKTKEADALLRKFESWFLGDFATKKPPTWKLEWFCGYIKHATIGWNAFAGQDDDDDGDDDDDTSEAERCAKRLAAFLALPSAQFLQGLALGPVPGDDELSLDGLAEVIEQARPACLRTLFLGNIGDWDISSTSTSLPDSKSIRALREVRLRGGNVTIGEDVDLPELVSFAVESGSLTKEDLEAIAAAKWPKLERLEIWCGDPNYGATGTLEDLAPIFEGKSLPKLKHLGIRNCPFADAVANALISSKLLRQLDTLDLSMGNLSDAGLAAMAAAKDAFAHLALLNLDDNALTSSKELEVLTNGLAKHVNIGTQDSPERAVPRGEGNRWSRYVAVGE
jgi:uncharacterized protein (TIGR02996 family)